MKSDNFDYARLWLEKMKSFPVDSVPANASRFLAIMNDIEDSNAIITMEFYGAPATIEHSISFDVNGSELIVEGPFFGFMWNPIEGASLDVLGCAPSSMKSKMGSWARKYGVRFGVLSGD